MPCYSSVGSKMVEAGRLVEALAVEGFPGAVVSADGLTVSSATGKPLFSRSRVADGFASVRYESDLDAAAVAPIGRRYAALSVQAFAKRRGFSVVSADGQRMVLKNRRGI